MNEINKYAYMMLAVFTGFAALASQEPGASATLVISIILSVLALKFFCIGAVFMDLRNAHPVYRVVGGVYTAIVCIILGYAYF
jgi:hypothetical protein